MRNDLISYTCIPVLYILSVLTTLYIVGALKSIYEMKCALLDKIVNFGTQIVKGTPWDETFSMLSILKI